MLEFLRIQYQLGRLTPEQLRGYVPRWITAAQAEGIIQNEEETQNESH